MMIRLRWWVLLSTLSAISSFFLLYYVVTNLWPEPGEIWARPQVLFLIFMFLTLSTGAIPVSAYMNYRFAKPDWRLRDKTRLFRQGAWVGLLGVLLAYLQLIRALNWATAIVLAGVFIFIEAFLLTRE
jgi:hypothetical protein